MVVSLKECIKSVVRIYSKIICRINDPKLECKNHLNNGSLVLSESETIHPLSLVAETTNRD